MAAAPIDVRKFLLGHYFHTGLRQALGTLTPPMVLIGLFHLPVTGVAAAFGALCVSIVDQPGPVRHRLQAMVGCALLGTVAALLTGVATSWPALLLAVVILQTFIFGLFSGLGQRGGMIGFACLLLMTLTMHKTVPPDVAAWHALATLGGGVWYLLFSTVWTRLQQARLEQQSLAVALFATASYIDAKAAFYDIAQDLNTSYQKLVPRQALLADKQQAARDMILTSLPQAIEREDKARIRLGNLFIDMVDLQETMLATYTDYAELRRALGESDFLLFGRDALRKLAFEIDGIGMALVSNRRPARTTGIKAEVRAMEYEAVLMRRRRFDTENPEAWVVVVQVLRRLRTASRLLARMQDHTHTATPVAAAISGSDNSLDHFFSREDFSLRRLLSHFSLSSPHMRYALRLTIAVGLGLSLGWLIQHVAARYGSELGQHGYWVVLTILVIMKPGFALSGQRNRYRLAGTLIGCSLVLILMTFTQEPWLLLGAMFMASVLSNSLLPLNYFVSAIFNTMLVLIGFHFLAPGSLAVVGERALDAAIGSALVWLCSWILPSWESRSIAPLARKAVAANRRFLTLSRQPPADATGTPGEVRGDIGWRLARRDVYTAFGNFADAFYRMMLEPASRRHNVRPLNDLLVQNHMLASETSSLSTMLPVLGPETAHPPPLRELLDTLEQRLDVAEQALASLPGPQSAFSNRASRAASQPAQANQELVVPPSPSVDVLPLIARSVAEQLPAEEELSDDPAASRFDVAHLTYELRQMIRTIDRIVEDSAQLAGWATPAAQPEATTEPTHLATSASASTSGSAPGPASIPAPASTSTSASASTVTSASTSTSTSTSTPG